MSPAASHKIDDFEPLLIALQNMLGVVVPDAQRNNLVEKIEPLLLRHHFDSLAALAENIQGTKSDVLTDVLDVISQRQSSWYLCTETKNILNKYVFEQLPENARIWVVGCGQGQLAYAVAMELAEYEHRSGDIKNIQIMATDVSRVDVAKAESATYTTQQLSSLSADYKSLYITQQTTDSETLEGWRVKDNIRQRVSFSQCDLTQDFSSYAEMDLIICPEALVYFSNGVKARILHQFSEVLKSGGILLTGNNLVASTGQSFERVQHPAGVFYRQKS